MLLIDTDNIFRIAFFLFKHKTSKFSFDAIKLELIDNKTGLCIPYPVFPIWQKLMKDTNFFIVRTMGDYRGRDYSIYSPRLILVARKTT